MEYLKRVLSDNKNDILLLQETRVTTILLQIPGYDLVSVQGHPKHGMTTYVKHELTDITLKTHIAFLPLKLELETLI